MNHDPKQSCSNCVCFSGAKTANDTNGYCQLYPPKREEPTEFNKEGKGKPRVSLPTVPPNGWCRQWEAAFVVPAQIAKK